MSSVGVGVAGGVGLGVVLGVSAVVTLARRGERADLRRAERFAKEQDLWLPPELARGVGARVRVRSGVGALLSALVAVPLFGWYFGQMAAHFDDPVTPGRLDPFHGPMLFALYVAPLGLINLAVHVWETGRTRRRAGASSTPAPRPARLADVVPPWLTWISRGLSAAVPVTAVVAYAAHGRTAQAGVFGGLVIAAPLVALGVEQLQLRILNGRRAELTGPELAFDEAFRVSTVLPQVMVAPMLVTLACVACLGTLGDTGHWGPPLFIGWVVSVVGGAMLLNAVVAAPAVRQYYRRRLPLSRVPETAPC